MCRVKHKPLHPPPPPIPLPMWSSQCGRNDTTAVHQNERVPPPVFNIEYPPAFSVIHLPEEVEAFLHLVDAAVLEQALVVPVQAHQEHNTLILESIRIVGEAIGENVLLERQ